MRLNNTRIVTSLPECYIGERGTSAQQLSAELGIVRMRALAGHYAVARLAADAPIPSWIRGDFVSITRTGDELSIVCDDDAIPNDIRAERDFRALVVEGPIPFDVVGVAAAITSALAAEKISVFFVSTFDTDYVLVKDNFFDRACRVLQVER